MAVNYTFGDIFAQSFDRGRGRRQQQEQFERVQSRLEQETQAQEAFRQKQLANAERQIGLVEARNSMIAERDLFDRKQKILSQYIDAPQSYPGQGVTAGQIENLNEGLDVYADNDRKMVSVKDYNAYLAKEGLDLQRQGQALKDKLLGLQIRAYEDAMGTGTPSLPISEFQNLSDLSNKYSSIQEEGLSYADSYFKPIDAGRPSIVENKPTYNIAPGAVSAAMPQMGTRASKSITDFKAKEDRYKANVGIMTGLAINDLSSMVNNLDKISNKKAYTPEDREAINLLNSKISAMMFDKPDVLDKKSGEVIQPGQEAMLNSIMKGASQRLDPKSYNKYQQKYNEIYNRLGELNIRIQNRSYFTPKNKNLQRYID